MSAGSLPGQRALRLVATAPQTSSASSPGTPSRALQRLQRDLEASQAEALSLQELLEQLPAILERKFQLHLNGLLAEQHQLERDNALLRHHLLGLRPITQGAEPTRGGWEGPTHR
jgi:hypothetical protein